MKKQLVVLVAVALALIPLVIWALSAVQEFGVVTDPAYLGLYVPARAFALLGFVLMFYQFVLAARFPALERIVPRVQQLKTHRSLGKLGGILILIHGVFMLLFDIITQGAIVFTFGKLLGIAALFLLINAVVAAWFFKPLKFDYKTWKRIHILAYFVFPLVFLHATLIGGTVRGYLAVRLLFGLFFVVYLVILARKLTTVVRSSSSGN